MTVPLDHLASALADQYRIERELGQGGMATVYLAEDLKHRRLVAVKVLRPQLAAALGAERFLREIELTAGLDHPHILPLYDSGKVEEAAGEPGGKAGPPILYYVMPYVEGESLRDRLRRERQLPLEDAVRITRDVADALSYAHSRGVIHRDIKPENILLSGGHARVADFGIARAIDVASGGTLTETGLTLGTPAYMSPEQAAAEKQLDGRSDLYALGCVLYEALGGQPPFTGPTAESVVHQHLVAAPVPVTQLRPAAPPEVTEALQRALAKTPADRFSTVRQFAEALGTGHPTPSQPVPGTRIATPRRHVGRAVAVVTAMVLLGAGFGAGTLLVRRPPDRLPLGHLLQVTLDAGLELDPALSPDGKFLAYSGPHGDLLVRQVEGGDPIHVVRGGDPRGRWPAWTPDGQSLVYLSPRGVETVPAFGGSPRFLAAQSTPERGLALSPDGKSFAFVSRDSLYAEPLAGGAARLVAVSHEMHSPAWSPDGRWIAFVSGNVQFVKWTDLGNVAHSSIQVVAAGGGTPVAVTGDQTMNLSPAWAAAGTLLYVSNRDGARDVYQLRLTGAGAPAGPAVRLTTGLNAHGIAVSLDGSRLAYSAFSETSNVWSLPIPRTGSVSIATARQLTRGNQVIENIDVTQDGRWLAFSADRNGAFQIYRQRLNQPGAEPQQITTDTAGAWWDAWSPDDKEIAFHRFQGERRVAYVMPADGGTATRVTDGTQDERSPEWSPDGRQLLLLANWGTTPALHIVTRKPDGSWSAPRTVPVVIGSDTIRSGLAAWSPDGRQLACGCGPGGLVIVPVDGGQARRLPQTYSTAGWAFPQWSADGRTIYYLSEDSGRVAYVVAQPLSGAPAHIAVRFDDPARPWHRFGFRVRAGKIFTELGDRESDIWVVDIRGKHPGGGRP